MRTSFPVAAPPAAWAAIGDPARLAVLLPGCRSVTHGAGGVGNSAHGSLHVVAEVAVASVRGLWAGTVAAVDADTVRVTGSGAPGTVDLVVRADPERTTLTVEGTVTGALATVGSSVLAAAIRRLALDLLAAAAAPAPAAEVYAAPMPRRRDAPAAPAGGRRRGYRLLGAGAAAVGIVLVARRRRARGQ